MSKKSQTKHPAMKMVKVIFTTGEILEIPMSSKGYEKTDLHLQSDPTTHRAWRAKGQTVASELKGIRAQELLKKYPKITL